MRLWHCCLTAVLICTAGVFAAPPNPDLAFHVLEAPAPSPASPSVLDPLPIACPPDSFVNIGQPAFGESQAWQIFVSNDRLPGYDPANGVLLYEYFAAGNRRRDIRDIHWWGVGATYDDRGDLVECPLEPGNFQIQFWLHDDVQHRPDYVAGPVYGFAASGAELDENRHRSRVPGCQPGRQHPAEYRLWSWGCDLPSR